MHVMYSCMGILLKNAQWPALQLACMISLVDYHARSVRSVIGWFIVFPEICS